MISWDSPDSASPPTSLATRNRTFREEIEATAAKARYEKQHAAGKTEEAKGGKPPFLPTCD